MDNFKVFLLNEDRNYLGQRVGDVLTSMQELQEDLPNLGSRHLVKIAEEIINQIRKIIHSRWAPKNNKYLKELQRVGVALKKTIEDKGDLREILPAATQAMQDLSSQLGVKVNSVQGPEDIGGEDVSMKDFQLTATGPQQPNAGQQMPDPNQQQLDPNQQGAMPPTQPI